MAKTFIIEPHSVYFLYPSEGPGVSITSVIFNGKNYDLWEKVVKMALKSKIKLGFIEGTMRKQSKREKMTPRLGHGELYGGILDTQCD